MRGSVSPEVNRCAATCIRATVTPNRSIFGIPSDTSLPTRRTMWIPRDIRKFFSQNFSPTSSRVICKLTIQLLLSLQIFTWSFYTSARSARVLRELYVNQPFSLWQWMTDENKYNMKELEENWWWISREFRELSASHFRYSTLRYD